MRNPEFIWMGGLCALLSGAPALAQEVSPAVHHDVSPPLRAMSRPPLAGPKHETPLFRLHGPVSNQSDPVVQTSAGPLVGTSAGLNFAGVGLGDYGFAPDAAPPDTEGTVGATQYVQWVNESFAVFDKTTGALILGPTLGNSLWSGFGGGCQTNNDGDPIVQYDKSANRWVFTQFSVSSTPYLQCVAVSTTSDATGTYFRYSFTQPNFPDYPKLGVWPDAYYISFNMFSGNSFVGGRACAFDRTAMLAGAAATQVCFQLSNSYGGLLPSDLDGSTAPPAGSPNFFVAFNTNSLDLWKFHINFVTPTSSTFTGPTNIPVAAFSAACGGGGTCIPQLGTNQQLDSLADRLMYRLAYRNFGDHEALVVNHSVTAGTSVGVRWYELRSPNSTPVVFQQGTYAPDSNYRWMGSIAMDQGGNIALGYSVSSGSMNPAIRYTGRVPTDTLGTMEAENIITTGTGSQTSGLSRWGDYSAMTIDPVDDCTFFYTNEYLKANGSFNWSTRIATFKFPSCGPQTADFSLSATPASQTVTQGGSTSYSVTATPSNGYNKNVTLSVSAGLPSGASANFGTNPILGGSGSSALSVNSGTAAAGTYTLTVSGTDGTLTHTTSFTLIINAPAVPDFTISASPTTLTVTSGGTPGTSTITIGAVNGYTGTVNLSVSGCPASGATCIFNPTSVVTAGTSTLTVTNTSALPGSYTLTITGTDSSNSTLKHSTTVTLTVPADFTISTNAPTPPATFVVKRSSSNSLTVTVTLNGASSVALSISGLPSRTSSSFNPSTVTATGTSTLKITANRKATPGTYTVTVTGKNAWYTHTTQFLLQIQ